MMKTKLHDVFGDSRGNLIAMESQVDVPFNVKRIFYIYGTLQNVRRGQHAHHTTRQYLIAVNGSCKVTLDDGQQQNTFDLNKPHIGLLQEALVWGQMHSFTDDCVLLVLASESYDDADYIRDYGEFLDLVKV